jgi:hypothetical protein
MRHDRSTFVAYGLMLAIPLLLFRVPVLGNGTWIGNPDRLNNQLKLLLFYVRGIASGNLAAWNEHEMLGFDSFVMPGIFPGPTTWLSAALEGSTFLHSEGWVNVVLLVLAGVAALAFLRRIGSGWFEAVVGAACYQLCGVTILRVSQYDISAAILIVIPLALILVREARRERAAVVFLGLVVLVVSMLLFMTLQSVAYVVMLIGAYAVWRGLCAKSVIPLVLTAASTAVAVAIASPRLLGNALAIRQYSRATRGVDLRDFDRVYELQNIRSYEILRWLDGTIFGISPSDGVRIHNGINLAEGFLLATSAAVPTPGAAEISWPMGRTDVGTGEGYRLLVLDPAVHGARGRMQTSEPPALPAIFSRRFHARANSRHWSDCNVRPNHHCPDRMESRSQTDRVWRRSHGGPHIGGCCGNDDRAIQRRHPACELAAVSRKSP